MEAIARIQAATGYTPAERRVADYCVQTYPKIAFTTVAQLAQATGTSAPTVMRFSAKAGFSGFTELQNLVRQSLESDASRALDRLDRRAADQADAWPSRRLHADIDHLERTYRSLSPDVYEDIVGLLDDDSRPIYLAGGEVTHGLCLSFAALLRWLRDDVYVLGTSAAGLPSELALLPANAVVVALHLRRLTHLINDVISAACAAGCQVIVGTNSPTLTLPADVRHVVVVHLEGENEILDSYTAIASLFNGFAAAVAERRRPTLRTRLDRLEAQWRSMSIYTE
jgi:DNA-binding MurR/RpiR family transcriptional regulator